MTYKNNFVVAVRAANKILRENNSTVAIPFGSEYQIVLKNLNTVRAQAKVEIDGEDVSGWLILQPNSKLELERFIRNGNLTSGNRFRFIERTSKIEDHRGIGIEDGIVKVTYKFEKIFKQAQTVVHHYDHYWPGYPWYQPQVVITTTPAILWDHQYTIYNNSNLQGGLVSNTQTSGSLGGADAQVTYGSVGSMGENSMNIFNCSVGETRSIDEFSKLAGSPKINGHTQNSAMMSAVSMSENTAGITVPGSESNQTFHNVSGFACEDSAVIVLKLIGAVGETKVTKAITVDVKPKCVTCGRVNKATNKFCSECGTSLVII
jgi:hypothetical protein